MGCDSPLWPLQCQLHSRSALCTAPALLWGIFSMRVYFWRLLPFCPGEPGAVTLHSNSCLSSAGLMIGVKPCAPRICHLKSSEGETNVLWCSLHHQPSDSDESLLSFPRPSNLGSEVSETPRNPGPFNTETAGFPSGPNPLRLQHQSPRGGAGVGHCLTYWPRNLLAASSPLPGCTAGGVSGLTISPARLHLHSLGQVKQGPEVSEPQRASSPGGTGTGALARPQHLGFLE